MMLLFLWLFFGVSSEAFQPLNLNAISQKSFSTFLANIEDAGSESEKEKKGKLQFRASKTFVSDPLPLSPPESERALEHLILDDDTIIDILRGAGNEALCAPQDITISNVDAWERECENFGVKAPSLANGDKVFWVTTGMNFPGLRISSRSFIGVKGLTPTRDPLFPYPGLEFVLIKDEQEVEGTPPLMWIFNKLTGSSGGDKGEQSVRSLNRVTIEPSSDGKEMVFQSNVLLEIDVLFPSIFLKLLPVSKDKAEEQGSASISKALDKDIVPALKRLRDSWEKVSRET